MNSISTTDSVSPTHHAEEMVPTPDNSGGSVDVFAISSSTDTIDADDNIPFDINHIPKIPHSSIFGMKTSNEYPSDDDSYKDNDSSNDDEVDQYVQFDAGRFPDGANGSMYMKPPSPSPKAQRFARKHQKKRLGQHSRRTTPNKLNLITPLPDSQVHSNYHSEKYHRDMSKTDKSSAGSNHDTIHKHHLNCRQNPSDSTRRPDIRNKKSPSKSPPTTIDDKDLHPCPFQLREKRKYDRLYQLRQSPYSGPALETSDIPTSVIADVSIVGTPIFTSEPFELSNFSTHIHIGVVVVLENDALTLSRNDSILLLRITSNSQTMFLQSFLLLLTQMTLH